MAQAPLQAEADSVMEHEVRDITIIGGGPTGLYAAFYAGMRERTVRIIDSLPELGGQLMALYPEKYIYDVGGFPKVLAKDLARELIAQATQFSPEIVLDEEVLTLGRREDEILLGGRRGTYATRALILCGGKGAFEPMKLKCPGFEEFLGKGVGTAVRDPEEFRGTRVLLVGGGDSAVDWAMALKDLVAELLLIHRRNAFRAHEKSVADLHMAADAGALTIRAFHEVKEIRGTHRVESAVIFDNRTGEEEVHEVDEVLTFLGFKPDLGPINGWGLDLAGSRVVVGRLMETSLPGVFAAGDLVDYEGKLDLIATGFAEAATAVNSAVHFIDPGARNHAGHSTNLRIFKDS